MKSLLLGLCFLGALSLSAADLSGKWTGQIDVKEHGESKTVPVLMLLKQDGVKVTGTAGGGENDQHPIKSGSVEGDQLTLEVDGGEDTYRLALKVDGDEMSGDIQKGDSDKMKIAVKRVKE